MRHGDVAMLAQTFSAASPARCGLASKKSPGWPWVQLADRFETALRRRNCNPP